MKIKKQVHTQDKILFDYVKSKGFNHIEYNPTLKQRFRDSMSNLWFVRLWRWIS